MQPSGTNRDLENRKSTMFEVVSREGDVSTVQFSSATDAAAWSRSQWPDQEQDEERTGKGWDIQTIGADR